MWKLTAKVGEVYKYFEQEGGYWVDIPLLDNKEYLFCEFFTEDRSYRYLWYAHGLTIRTIPAILDPMEQIWEGLAPKGVIEIRLTLERFLRNRLYASKVVKPLMKFKKELILSWFSPRDLLDAYHGYTEEEIYGRKVERLKEFARATANEKVNSRYFYNILFGKKYSISYEPRIPKSRR